jgi:hypothetical protein
MKRLMVLAFPALLIACGNEPVSPPLSDDLVAPQLSIQETFDPAGGVGDAIIRSAVFTSDKRGRVTAVDGIFIQNEDGSIEIQTRSLEEWRGGGAQSGQVVHVGRGCESKDYRKYPAGSIALIERGGCHFSIKIGLAQLAEATGVIIYNRAYDENVRQSGERLMRITVGDIPFGVDAFTVPVAFIKHSDGVALRDAAPVEARMEGAAFEVLEETVDYLADSERLPHESAESLKYLVREAEGAALAGQYKVAKNLLAKYQREVTSLEKGESISYEDWEILFYAAVPITYALRQAEEAEVG